MARYPACLSARFGVLAILLAMLVAPFFSHPEYSALAHTTSQLGGQNMPGAWIMNGGFVLFGSATALAALASWRKDGWRNFLVLLFGLAMVATGLWSTGTAEFGNPVNAREDWWHSFFATALGFAFAGACAAALFGPRGRLDDPISWVGLAASALLPLAMQALGHYAGALQRAMFAISFVWIWHSYCGARTIRPGRDGQHTP